jgi:hypothetical protein
MAFLFGRGLAAVWCGPQSNDAEVVAVNLTADVAAAHSALTGTRHAPYFSLGDARPYDLCPDRCWRCNAVQGETDVGLCAPCHADLTNPT